MSTQDRKKAWFVDGLRLLPDKIKAIEYQYLLSVNATRKIHKGVFSIEAAKERRNDPDVIAWNTYRDDIVAELDATVRVGNEFIVDLPACRKLSIALSQGFYRDDSTFILDAIAEVAAATDKIACGINIDPDLQKAIDIRKQSNGATSWPDVCEKITGVRDNHRSFSNSVRAYAEKTNQQLPDSGSGSKPKRHQ